MNDDEAREMARVTRRDFLKWMGIGTGAAAIAAGSLHYFRPADAGDNPLARSVNREWEKIYRDQYKYDSAFDWVCSPNDTHACRVRAYVRNGIVTRMGEHLRLPKLRRPLRQQGHGQLEPAPVRQGLHLPSRHLRALPPAPSDRAQRLEGLGRCRLSRAHAGEQSADTCSTPAARTSSCRFPGTDAFDYIAKALVAIARATAARQGKKLLAGAGLSAGNGRGDGRRRHAHDQNARRHGAARRDRQVRHVPPQQLARAARREDPRRRPGGGARRAQLVELHLARRPGAGPSLGARPAGVGVRLQRPALLQAHHHGRQEPGREQDDRLALVHRVHGARRKDRRDRAGVRPALDQGRLLDSDPAADRRRALARRHQADDRQEMVRRSVRQALHRFSAAGPHRQPQAPARARGLPGLQDHVCPPTGRR